ncbi:hypothetical protein ACFYYR_11260 [Streptomyces sp. NPDC001922]|uniref:hypothetical protein n=1 Tax=Streptomyces sp. NPDC001922 TaxID=3364624 RepID=UPI0036919A24
MTDFPSPVAGPSRVDAEHPSSRVDRLERDAAAQRAHREQLEQLVRKFALRVKSDQGELEQILAGVLRRLDALETGGGSAAGGGPVAGGSSAAGGVRQGSGPDPAAALPWSARAAEQDWRDLAAWVDWLSAHYAPQLNLRIWPCWPLHGGVAEELAALRSAWCAAAQADAQSGGTGPDLAYWHQMWLWPTLERIRQHYMFKSCESDHTPDRPGRLTDPAALGTRIDAAGRTNAASRRSSET